MVSETGKIDNPDGLNNPPEKYSEKNRKDIEKYSIIAFFCLIAAILLISL